MRWWDYAHEGPEFTWFDTAHIIIGISLAAICFMIVALKSFLQKSSTLQKVSAGP
ncbi:hypothetical protein ACE1TI_15990 [Alteribacillus sp. JSM 102045]|uniref:hypothetical protein n=1 Tax=Alteribacillus sp. JSM 102045 TaxID=1562101 RepID=UPI0035C1A03D